MNTKTVYVVAVCHEGSSGFNWHITPEAANRAFEAEKRFVDEFKSEGWTAYRFDCEVQNTESSDSITEEIDGQIDELCAQATLKYSV